MIDDQQQMAMLGDYSSEYDRIFGMRHPPLTVKCDKIKHEQVSDKFINWIYYFKKFDNLFAGRAKSISQVSSLIDMQSSHRYPVFVLAK